jgi:2-C-methyl-D-erythritol 4-phosphate cytidylyltransferase
MKTTAIILAAGNAKRMMSCKNKLFLELQKPILIHTIEVFEKHDLINDIIIVVNKKDLDMCDKVIKKNRFKKIKKIVTGGKTRQESSYNGVMQADSDIILIHDGARPLVKEDSITNSIKDALTYGASTVAVPLKETLKKVENLFVEKTLERDSLWVVQTPQTFKKEIIKKAHESAKKGNFSAKDDSALVERLGFKVKVSIGHYENLKITTPDDLIIAKHIFKKNNGNKYD